MKRYFCTLFDSNYLIKGLTMINSLNIHCKEFEIYVLCIDNKTKSFLENINISQVKCIELYDVENKSLLKAKKNRTKTEYCWTLASFFTWYVMNKFNNNKGEIIAASDAFFPFLDGVEKLVQSGISAIIQPQGSIKDKEVIKFANRTNTILIFSKTRHFYH